LSRWYIENYGGAEITRTLITLGTPYRGAASALAQFVNGAHPGLGPFRLGAYTIEVAGPAPAAPLAPVSSDILIWDSRATEPATG
jgi:hypothetical protein